MEAMAQWRSIWLWIRGLWVRPPLASPREMKIRTGKRFGFFYIKFQDANAFLYEKVRKKRLAACLKIHCSFIRQELSNSDIEETLFIMQRYYVIHDNDNLFKWIWYPIQRICLQFSFFFVSNCQCRLTNNIATDFRFEPSGS